MSNAISNIDSLREESRRIRRKADRIEQLLAEYPDLRRHEDRWRKEYYCSEGVNGIATECWISHSCGCCADSPVLVKPYVEFEDGFRVFAFPYSVCVGEKDAYGYGDRRYPGWKEAMEKVGYSAAVIDRVDRHFRAYEEGSENEED